MDSNQNNGGDNVFKTFQLTNNTASKSDNAYGLQIAQAIQSTLSSNTSYFYLRNTRIRKNRDMAHGRYDVMTEFMDRMGFDGKVNYANLMWLPFHIVNTIISRKVGAWMGRNEKIQVEAKDSTSISQRNKRYEDALFYFEEKERNAQLQKASGVPMVPQDAFVAEDRDELELWKSEFNRIPEEIDYELTINQIFDDNGFFDVLKEKMLHDSAEAGLVGIYTDMDEYGEIKDYWIEPENQFYSFSKFPDFRDCTWMGDGLGFKIKDIRRKYSIEFGGKMTEQQIWNLAQYCKEYQRIDTLTWLSEWSTSLYRPYDEWNLECLRFEIKTYDTDTYSMSVSEAGTLQVKKGNIQNTQPVTKMFNDLKAKLQGQKTGSIFKSAISNILNQYRKKLTPEETNTLRSINSGVSVLTDDNQINTLLTTADAIVAKYNVGNEKVAKDKCDIYKGIYAKDAKVMLEWGLKKNQITSQDKTEVNRSEFGYSYYMYQNYDMRNLAIPEKIEEPFKNMVLVRLKMQQLTMKMKPIGAAINENALRNIDYGLADANQEIDYKKLYDQTGDIYYNGIDTEGNPIPIPITELQNAGFLPQMQGLIQLYAHHYQVLKSELGEDPELASQAATPRVTSENVQQALVQGDNATDYMYDAYLYVMEMAAKKKAILLNDSVTYGATVYRSLLKEEDVRGRIFSTRTKMLPNAQELAQLQNMINQSIASNPDFVVYLDVFKVMRIAKEDIKAGELYYRNCMKRMVKTQAAIAKQNTDNNASVQQASLDAKAKGDKELLESKLNGDERLALLNGAFAILAKEGQVPPNLQPVLEGIIQNISLPLMVENEKIKQGIAQMQQQQVQQAQQEQQQPQQQEMQQSQEQPIPQTQ